MIGCVLLFVVGFLRVDFGVCTSLFIDCCMWCVGRLSLLCLLCVGCCVLFVYCYSYVVVVCVLLPCVRCALSFLRSFEAVLCNCVVLDVVSAVAGYFVVWCVVIVAS